MKLETGIARAVSLGKRGKGPHVLRMWRWVCDGQMHISSIASGREEKMAVD